MRNNIIQRLVIFGALSIIGIIATQSYWVMKTWDLKEKQFDQTVNIALLNTARDLEVLSNSTLPDQDLVNRIASNYYVVNINGVINASNLEFYLKKEFEAVALKEDFEYGIYDCHSNRMMYGNYITYSPDKDKVTGKRDLPTYSEFTYYFGVRFPNRTSFILSTMRVTIIFSIVLLVSTAFFIYALLIILQQKKLSEMQKDFINNMTHEFKTPISTIKISADVFLNNPLIQADKRLMQYAHIIREQNERLNNQVEKVLQLAKIERNSLELNLERIDLHELIGQITPSLEMKIIELHGQVKMELAANQPIIKADRLHLTNILHNLFDNAVKYSKEAPEVTLRTEDANGKIRLIVSDKGVGIDKIHHAKVFDKFYRVPTGNVHNVKGFGLGLFYLRNICQAHGWKVNLDSEPGKGTAVSIEMKRWAE